MVDTKHLYSLLEIPKTAGVWRDESWRREEQKKRRRRCKSGDDCSASASGRFGARHDRREAAALRAGFCFCHKKECEGRAGSLLTPTSASRDIPPYFEVHNVETTHVYWDLSDALRGIGVAQDPSLATRLRDFLDGLQRSNLICRIGHHAKQQNQMSLRYVSSFREQAERKAVHVKHIRT